MAAAFSAIFNLGVLLLFAISLVATGTEATVSGGDHHLLPVCKTVGGGSTFFDVEFCVSALGSDNRSHTAKRYRDFSVISLDLLTANATRTVARINGMIKAGGGGKGKPAMAMARCLETCRALYDDILLRQLHCAALVKDSKFWKAAAILEMSADEVTECEEGFGKSSVVSPVTAEDVSAFKLVKLAAALLLSAGGENA